MNDTSYNIERLTHEQVRQLIDRTASIIIPLGGCEPFGAVGALGTGTVCAAGVAQELSRRRGTPVAPPVSVGCATPFAAFHGAAGVKPRTFVNMLCEIIGGYVFQGVKRVFLVSAAPFNAEPAAEAAARLNVKFPRVEVKFFDISAFGNNEFDRDDAGLLSMAAYLWPTSAAACSLPPSADKMPAMTGRYADVGQYRTWKKRGKDPQKLRSLFPNGLFVDVNAGDVDAERGRKLFERVVAEIENQILFMGTGGAPVTPRLKPTMEK